MNLLSYNRRQNTKELYRFLTYSLLISYISIFFVINKSFAQAGGLTKARSTLQAFQDELISVVPIVAVISLVILAISYAAKIVEKETFMRWAIGVIIVGSAAPITTMLLR